MIAPALLLQVVASFTFTNGARVEVRRDSGPDPVALHMSQGIRSATQRLDASTAGHWAYEAAIASTIGSRLLAPDSLEGYARVLSAFTVRVSCGRAGCKATVINLQLWGSSYAYLRPGPLPLPQMLILAQALRQAAGLPNVGAPPWPYTWQQP